MGTVYLAYHEILERPVALKVPHQELSNNDVFVQRFLREARALGTLHHSNIVTVYDAGIENDTPYIAMKYIAGVTLSQYILSSGQVEIDTVLHWGRQMADALAYLHDQQILHRDLKSANVIIDQSGDAIIADFGIAQIEADSNLTRGVLGTPSYMSPEQAMGKSLDARSDMYALGVILYQCLTGELPFQDENSLALIQKVIHETPKSVYELRPDTPEWLEDIINRCLRKHPGHRFKDDHELLAAFDNGLTRPVRSNQPQFFLPVRRKLRTPGTGLVAPKRQAPQHALIASNPLDRPPQAYHNQHTVTYFESPSQQYHSPKKKQPLIHRIIQHGMFLSLAAVLALILVAPLAYSRLTGVSPSEANGKGSDPSLAARDDTLQESLSTKIASTTAARSSRQEKPLAPSPQVSQSEQYDSLITSLQPGADSSVLNLGSSMELQPLSVLPITSQSSDLDLIDVPEIDSTSVNPGPKGTVRIRENLSLPEVIVELVELDNRRQLIQALEVYRKQGLVSYGDRRRVREPDLAYIFLMNSSDDGLHSLLIPTPSGWTDIYSGDTITEDSGKFYNHPQETTEKWWIHNVEPIWVELYDLPVEEENAPLEKKKKKKRAGW